MSTNPYLNDLPKPAPAKTYFEMMSVPVHELNPSNPKVNVPNVVIDSEMAHRILQNPKRMQRTTRSPYITRLGKAMAKNKFVSDAPIVIGMVTTDFSLSGIAQAPAYLLDGQHRINGVERGDTHQVFDFVFRTFANEDDMMEYALSIDSGVRRNHHHRGSIAELGLRLGVGDHEAGAFEKAIRAIIRLGLDPTAPFIPADEKDNLRVYAAYEHYLTAGQHLFNLLHHGSITPRPNSKEFNPDFKKRIRDITAFAPLLVWTNKNTQLVRDFLVPILTNDQSSITPAQNVFVQLLRQGMYIRPHQYRSIMGDKSTTAMLKQGARSQKREVMGTLLCLDRFRSSSRKRPFLMDNVTRDAIRFVDKAIDDGAEIAWPSPILTGFAKNI